MQSKLLLIAIFTIVPTNVMYVLVIVYEYWIDMAFRPWWVGAQAWAPTHHGLHSEDTLCSAADG